MNFEPKTTKHLLMKYNKGLKALIKYTESNKEKLSKREFLDNIDLIIFFVKKIKTLMK